MLRYIRPSAFEVILVSQITGEVVVATNDLDIKS